jgi:hypothetical protein
MNPKAGDVLRKWNQNFLVESFNQGAVYTKPSLSDRGWLGILFFLEWAADAEVLFEAHEIPQSITKCRFCGYTNETLDQDGHCQACINGMARTNGD